MSTNGLSSFIDKPTRVTEQSQTCIDHVFAIKQDVTSLNWYLKYWIGPVLGVVLGRGSAQLPASAPDTDYHFDCLALNSLLNIVHWSGSTVLSSWHLGLTGSVIAPRCLHVAVKGLNLYSPTERSQVQIPGRSNHHPWTTHGVHGCFSCTLTEKPVNIVAGIAKTLRLK
ncbi:hypothetical protein J6590_068718 [Homalodisca vitripennis]|nr:hypothetical protein J6590_068718 [Homalodisca vitripennis]